MREIPERIDTTFRFVLLVAHRAEQLMKGALPKLETPARPTAIAMKEIDGELVNWDYGPSPEAETEAAEGEATAEAAEVQ